MKMRILYYLIVFLTVVLVVSCQDNPENFDNKVYTTVAPVNKYTLKPSVKNAMKSIRASVSKPADNDIRLTYKVDPSLVNVYNMAYYSEAVLLPQDYYEMGTTEATINRGSILSTEIILNFKNLNLLSTDQIYVLPVTIADATNIDILSSASTNYFVFEGGALINVVADMKKENYISFPTFKESKPSGEICNNLHNYTLESLIRVREFTPGIQTIMGSEGYFLIRISDNGLLPNQIQISTPYGNFTNPATCLLTPNKWTHIALVGDAEAKEIRLYIDDVLAINQKITAEWKDINFGKPMSPNNYGTKNPFYIGYSYSAGRELNGEFSECRIWNTARTEEQIMNNIYEVDAKAEGLVAYWKFDEGQGNIVHDRTENGNDGVATYSIAWTPVSLPTVSVTE